MRVVYHPEAEAELIEAAEYYESRVDRLGEQFLREFEQSVDAIAAGPMRWQIVEGDLRRYLMR